MWFHDTRQKEALHRAQRQRDDATRKYRLTEHQFSIVQGALPLLHAQLQEAARRMDVAKSVRIRAQPATRTLFSPCGAQRSLRFSGVPKEDERRKEPEVLGCSAPQITAIPVREVMLEKRKCPYLNRRTCWTTKHACHLSFAALKIRLHPVTSGPSWT